MKIDKRWYIEYTFAIDEYEESGTEIIEAPGKKIAIKRLKEHLKKYNYYWDSFKIDHIHETTSDAIV